VDLHKAKLKGSPWHIPEVDRTSAPEENSERSSGAQDVMVCPDLEDMIRFGRRMPQTRTGKVKELWLLAGSG
jgi:hypothetical protein